MKLSYGLTVCNEHEEIRNLIEYLVKGIDKEDEIVVVYDQNRVTPEVMEVFDLYRHEVQAHPFDFQQNFLDNKNYLNSKCTGDYIFQLDADELPHKFLLLNLKTILESNSVDLLITPRKNLVEGLTQEYVHKWRWHVNEFGFINWPDWQGRIYRNKEGIEWTGKVHERITGFKTTAQLPAVEDYSLRHPKTIARQVKQNAFYDQL